VSLTRSLTLTLTLTLSLSLTLSLTLTPTLTQRLSPSETRSVTRERCNHWCLVWLKPGGSVLFELPGYQPVEELAESLGQGWPPPSNADTALKNNFFPDVFTFLGARDQHGSIGVWQVPARRFLVEWRPAKPRRSCRCTEGGKGAFNRGYLGQMIFNRRESCSQLLIGSVPFDRRIGDPFTIFSEGAVPGRIREILRGEPAKVCQRVAGFERRLLSREMR
jgi:hypothetical protein